MRWQCGHRLCSDRQNRCDVLDVRGVQVQRCGRVVAEIVLKTPTICYESTQMLRLINKLRLFTSPKLKLTTSHSTLT